MNKAIKTIKKELKKKSKKYSAMGFEPMNCATYESNSSDFPTEPQQLKSINMIFQKIVFFGKK